MVFRPSYAEFQNFSEYIAYMEKSGAHKAGLAKVTKLFEFLREMMLFEHEINVTMIFDR